MKAWRKTVVVLIVFALTSIDGYRRCPVGWQAWKQSCYMITPTPMRWKDVHPLCATYGARMAVPSSDEENQFMAQVASKAVRPFWINCNDAIDEGRWVCSEDAMAGMGYRNWADNQPNDWSSQMSGTGADFAAVGQIGPWSDFADELFHSFCKMKGEKPCPNTGLRCQAVTKQDAGPMTTPYCPLDHAYMVTQIKHPIQCCMACYKDPNCLSFNLSGKMCHLNNATISQVDADKFVTTSASCANYGLD